MLGEDAARFLKSATPFSLLDEQTLAHLVGGLTLQVFPAGAQILQRGDPPPQALYVIKEGVVKIFACTPAGEEQVLDFRSVGDTFGFLGLGKEERLDASVQALSDTVCYLIAGSAVLKLLEERPELRDYLVPAYFPKREGEVPWAALARAPVRGGVDRVIFTTPVEDLARPDVIAVSADTSIAEAARMMSAHGISALVVVDGRGLPSGIVTNTDLRDRVLVPGREQSGPVREIMTVEPICVQSREFCFEALLKMMSRGVHHLPVLNANRLAGVVSSHDFLLLQGTTPFLLAREIEGLETIEELASSSRRVKGLVSVLLREGAGARSITSVISAVNDQIERRVLDIALKTLGPPPVPFCWIVYGSAGRREQTFVTDQDNAIIYRDPDSEAESSAAQEYFGRLAQVVVDGFLRCGFALCRGNFMATNPAWRKPLGAWQRSFREWIGFPFGDTIYTAVNFFDFRGVHGDLRLAAALREDLQEALAGQERFLAALAKHAADFPPPVGLFGALTIERDGEHASQLDLKKRCLMPLVNAVRLFAFECGVPETSTLERLAVLAGVHPIARSLGQDLAHSFEFLSLLRIRHQHEQIEMDLEPDNYIQPARLSSLELSDLKQVSRLIAKLVNGIQKKYSGLSAL